MNKFSKYILYVPIGISGSGKSTYINKHFPKSIVVSPDEIRKRLTGDISDQSRNPEVFKTTIDDVISTLKKYGRAVLDATNVSTIVRQNNLNDIKEQIPNLKAVAIILKANPEISRKRIKHDLEMRKDRADVPDDVIDTQYEQFKSGYSDIKKQYDKIIHINENKLKLGNILKEVVDAEDAKIEWQTKKTNSKYFKKWFKNSKVVSKGGSPLIVYHGTPDGRFIDIDFSFKNKYERFKFISNRNQGHFFTDSHIVAKSYAYEKWAYDHQEAIPKIIAAYLSIQNPLEIDADGKKWGDYTIEFDGIKYRGTDEIVEYANESGHDGVIIKNVKDYFNSRKREANTTVYAVYKSTQIKSISNVGTFDENDPNIFK